MAEIVEPHPKLIEYYTIAKSLWNDIDELFFSQFKHKDECFQIKGILFKNKR